MASENVKGAPKNPDLGPYFTVPKGLIRNGIAARIGPSAVAVYVALCEHANRVNGNVVSVSDRAIATETDVAERTIREVRILLQSKGLVYLTRQPGCSYTYNLIPVKVERSIPVKDSPRPPKKPRAIHATRQAAEDTQESPKVRQNLPDLHW
jgi:hypothetical protein